MILGADPSSTMTGYAIVHDTGKMDHAGLFKPNSTKDTALVRIKAMCDDLAELLNEVTFSSIVVEVPSAEAHNKKDRKGHGLTIYGMAVGAIIRTIQTSAQAERLVTVDETVWTKGVSKRERAERVAMLYPNYRQSADKDPGLDVADAIGLCLWHIAESKTRRTIEGPVEVS